MVRIEDLVKHMKGNVMSKRFLVIGVAALIAAGVAYAQYPIMDAVANKVVQKYQTATCEQLWQEKAQKQGQPKPEMEQRAIKALKSGSPDAPGVLRQGLGADRQQDVRMRDDSLMSQVVRSRARSSQ